MPSRTVMIDPPSPFDSLAVWSSHLLVLYMLPANTSLRAEMIETAERQIAEMRQGGTSDVPFPISVAPRARHREPH